MEKEGKKGGPGSKKDDANSETKQVDSLVMLHADAFLQKLRETESLFGPPRGRESSRCFNRNQDF